MSKQTMRLRQLVGELTAQLERHGDVEVMLETQVRGVPDENSVDHVEVFHLHGDASKPVVVAICSEEGGL